MPCDRWTPRLSEYLDGELEPPVRLALETHLDECSRCRAALDDLRAVAAAAADLEDRAPDTDLWSGIEERITRQGRAPERSRPADADGEQPGAVARPLAASGRRRRISLTIPQLAAAAIALVLLSAGGARLLPPGGGAPADDGVPGRVAVPSGGPAGSGVRFAAAGAVPAEAEAQYGRAVIALREMLDRRRDRLDSVTVRVIEANLRAIDAAIRDAYAALADDPADPYLNHHLTRVRTRKLELLRRAVDATGSEL